jgi:predicted DNA-binding ribbon-helix-helix protein
MIAMLTGMKQTLPRKRSVRVAGHLTSVSVEGPFWEALAAIAARRGQPLNALIAAIDHDRTGNLSSAIRLFVLESCRRGELTEGSNSSKLGISDK